MSLVIRRVKEISKKRNKKSRKWYILEPFDDIPSKLLVDEEYGEEQDSLPSLNSVYKKTIVGTPILFRRISGWEYQETHSYNVNFQSITFMKEYYNNSFEELRWEDYMSNRKGNYYIHQETNYPRIVTNYNFHISDKFEFFHPLPRNISKHFDLGTVHFNEFTFSKKTKPQNIVFASKTADKTIKKSPKRCSSMPFTTPEDNPPKCDSLGRNSESNLWHLEQLQMSKEKIRTYFAKRDDVSVSREYDPNVLFFLPCNRSEDNKRTIRTRKKVGDASVPSCFGDGFENCGGNGILLNKYTDEGNFKKTYLHDRLNPYQKHQGQFRSSKNNCRQQHFVRCKNHILGREIIF